MKFILAMLAYLGFAALIGAGFLKAVVEPHSFGLLILALVLFFGAFIKAGCLDNQG